MDPVNEHLERVLGRAIVDLETSELARQHPGLSRMRSLMANEELTNLIKSTNFEAVYKWWFDEHGTHGVDAAVWWPKRECLMQFLLIIISATDMSVSVLRRKIQRENNDLTFNLTEQGNMFLATIRDWQRIHHSMRFRSQSAALLFIMLSIPGSLDWSWFEYADKATSTPMALAHMFLAYWHSVRYMAPSATEPIVSREFHIPPQTPDVDAQLRANPLWTAKELNRVLPQTCWEFLKWAEIKDVCGAPENVRLTVMDSKLTVTVWCHDAEPVDHRSYSIYKHYECLMDLLGRGADVDEQSLQLLKDDMDFKLSSQEMMKRAFQPRELRVNPATVKDDVSLPFIRMEKSEGQVRYPVQIPAAARPGLVLTVGQVKTLEFMSERETRSFFDIMCTPLNARGEFATFYGNKPTFRLADSRRARQFGGGMISDETGTGKTLCILLKCTLNPGERSVIIVPDALVMHWSSDIRKHTTLRVWEDPQYKDGAATIKQRRLVADTKEYEAIVLHRTQDIGAHTWTAETQPRVLIVSHSTLRSTVFRKTFESLRFDRMVIDEGHHVKSSTVESLNWINRNYSWVVTATPYENTGNLMKMLQLDKVSAELGVHDASKAVSSRLEFMMYRHLMTRSVFDKTHLAVDVVKRYCEMTPDEAAFFREIGHLIEEYGVHRRGYTDGLHRFFRILERIGAGGHVHKRLILQILRRTLDRSNNEPRAAAAAGAKDPLEGLGRAPRVAFCASVDECTVCLVPFQDPVQLGCGHVYCKPCLMGVLDLRIGKCAYCRAEIKLPYYTPNWPDAAGQKAAEEQVKGKRKAEEAPPPAPPAAVLDAISDDARAAAALEQRARAIAEDAHVDRKMYQEVLAGTAENVAKAASADLLRDLVNLQGKIDAMDQELAAWVARRKPGDQLVIFMKEQLPAVKYTALLQKHGLTLMPAGVLGARKLASIANIEKFRQGAADVLLCSNKYCDGFDLYMASEVWLMNSDLSAAKMEQSQGRVMRVIQKHPKITVRVFVYRGTFDEWLWDSRKTLSVRSGGYTRNHLVQFYFYSMSNTPDTTANNIKILAAAIRPGVDPKFHKGTIRYDMYTFDPSVRRMYVGRRNMRLVQLLSLLRNNPAELLRVTAL